MIKPQDLAVALQLLLHPGQPFRELARVVGVSPGEAHNAVQRLIAARLVRAPDRSVRVHALHEFLAGGVPYLYRTPGVLYPGAEQVGERNPTLASLLAQLDRLRHGGMAERPAVLAAVRETTRQGYRARPAVPTESSRRVVRVVRRDDAATSDDLSASTTAAERLEMVEQLSQRMREMTGAPPTFAVQRQVAAIRTRAISTTERADA